MPSCDRAEVARQGAAIRRLRISMAPLLGRRSKGHEPRDKARDGSQMKEGVQGLRCREELTSSSNGTIPPLPIPVFEACKGSDVFFSGSTLRAAFCMVSKRGMIRHEDLDEGGRGGSR